MRTAPASRVVVVASVLAISSFALPGRSTTALPLKHVADLGLPGNATRLDYQSLDPRRQLLFIAHLGDSEVIAVDTKTRRVLATIPGVSGAHGVLVVPELHTVYASATGTNEVVAIDESSFKIVARTDGGVYPDGIAFDPGTRRIFVSDEHGRTDSVIDTRTNKRIATIDLGGDVGNTQYDSASRNVFANVQTRAQLVEIDPTKAAVIKRYSLPETLCIGNHGLLIEPKRRRAFIACDESGTLLWVDMRTMHVVQSWPIGEDPDVLALDTGTRRLFIAAESGTVSIFNDGDRVTPVAKGYLAPAAHTVAVDPQSHLVYFPLENVNGKPVLRIMAQR